MVLLLVMSIRFISQFLNLVPQEILVTAPELQEDGMVLLLVMSIKYISQFLNPVPQEILVTAPELQEEMLGTKDGTSNVHLYSSDLHLDLVLQG